MSNILLHDNEMTELIKLAKRDNPALFGFGPSGAWLKNVPENDWAIKALEKMRADKGTA